MSRFLFIVISIGYNFFEFIFTKNNFWIFRYPFIDGLLYVDRELLAWNNVHPNQSTIKG